MNYLASVTRTRGYLTADREPEKPTRRCAFGFVPAEQYIREQPFRVSILMLATQHCMESKRVTRSMADFVAGYHLKTRRMPTNRDMQAVS
jgi:hypothetical protein